MARSWGKAANARLSTWALRRQGIDAPPFALASRRLYIVPTRRGAVFALVLLGMLFGGLNYANSLVLMLTFSLAAFAGVAMIQCHRRLRGLVVQRIHVPRATSGEPIPVELAVTAAAGQDLDGLRVRFVPIEGAPATWAVFESPETAPTAGVVLVPAPAARRGPWHPPRVRVESRVPFGLFKTWTWLHLKGGGLVWPASRGSLPLPRPAGGARGNGALEAGRDEWVGLRPFRDGDSSRLVAWKAYARGAPLLVREFREPRGADLHFDFATVQVADLEARLSQLARWIDLATVEGLSWSLDLPGAKLPLAKGAAARRAGLDALARHGFGSDAA